MEGKVGGGGNLSINADSAAHEFNNIVFYVIYRRRKL